MVWKLGVISAGLCDKTKLSFNNMKRSEAKGKGR